MDDVKDTLVAETIKAYKDGYRAGYADGVVQGKSDMVKAVMAIISAEEADKFGSILEGTVS